MSSSSILKVSLVILLFTSNKIVAQTPDSTATDSVLLKQVEEQMQAANQTAPPQTRSSLSFNPDIGLVADFQGSYISSGKKNIDYYLNETELSLQSVIDP